MISIRHSLRLTAVFVMFMVIVTCTSVLAEPLTLYKAGNIATARENLKRYAWSKDIVEGWKQRVERALREDREFFEDMISPLTPWPLYGQNCPACVGKQSTMGESGLYEWSVAEPDKLRCKYCGTVYPNSKYPETGSITCPEMGQTFTFYLTEEERAHPEDTSGKYAFRWANWPVHTSWSGILRYNRANWCISRILILAKLYAITGDVRYAERAALIMDIVAQRYPNWLYHSYNGTYADCPPGEAAASMGKYPSAGKFPVKTIFTAFKGLHTKGDYAVLNNGFWGAGRFGCSGSDGRLILDMTVAYDLIHEAERPDGRPVLSPEMSEQIVNDLILAGCEDTENWNAINNKCGPGRAMSGAVGILFNRPQSVRRALEGFEALMDHSFHFDGFCKETPSYSGMHLNLMRNIPEILSGYSDPEDFIPGDGRILKNFNPFLETDRYRLALASMVRMLDFNNCYPVIGDTHFDSGISPIYAEVLTAHYDKEYAYLLEDAQGAPLAEKGGEYALWHRPQDITIGPASRFYPSEWFPGWHVGVLRGGRAGSHTAFYFNGNAHGIHRHYDTLGIIYSAHGQELASDRGYIWDDPRNAWTKSTLSHNIVTVDGANQNVENCRSTLELFGVSPFVEVTQASANAYRQCDLYQRTCALVKLTEDRTYAVDFFRISGGKLHRYGFNCNGRLVNIKGANPKPADMEIKWLSNLRADTPSTPFSATWDYNGVKMDMLMLNDVDRLIVADAPGWRNNRGESLNAPPIQQILAEQTDETSAHSHFTVVMAPYKGASSPVKSARVILNDLKSGAIAAEVELADRTDYIISAADDKTRTYGPITMSGRFGFASVDAEGNLIRAYLLNGTKLLCGDRGISLAEARFPLKVTSVEGRIFRLAESIPSNLKLRGAYLLAGETGFEIESTTAKSITVRDYPAIECDVVTVINSGNYTHKNLK